MATPREIELKLELDPPRGARARGVLPRLLSLPYFGDPGTPRHLVSSIFDTPDLALRKQGLLLRIRHAGERRIQTIKSDGDGSFLVRPEWECDVSGDVPDFAAIPEELRESIAAAGELAPVLVTDYQRTLWHVRHEGSDLEVTLDEGEVRAGGRTAPIHEIEIELKSGASSAIFGIARDIVSAVAARPGLRSKSERGYALLASGGSVKGDPFEIDGEMSVATAFQTISRTCLRQYCLNEPGILARKASALHRGRVGLRRLRSCLKLHKRLIGDPEGKRLRGELRSLSRALGPARNLDVYLERLDAAGESDLRGRVAAERELAYDRLITRLRAKRTRLLLLDLLAYLETGAWLRDPAGRARRGKEVASFATKTLQKCRTKLIEDGRDLAAQTPEARHEVRIDGKVLRYAAEFFAGVFPGGKAKRRRGELLGAVTDLQTHLGDLNDMETWAAIDPSGALATPLDPQREAELIAAAQEAHRRIEEAEPFWRA